VPLWWLKKPKLKILMITLRNCDVVLYVLKSEALNQGTSGPNTAAFSVYDDSGNLITSNEWNLTTGIKATIVVVKEEEK
jgi:hypothetical protein